MCDSFYSSWVSPRDVNFRGKQIMPIYIYIYVMRLNRLHKSLLYDVDMLTILASQKQDVSLCPKFLPFLNVLIM